MFEIILKPLVSALQMYGLFFHGLSERLLSETHREMAKLADSMDMNDFLHANSPYLADNTRRALAVSRELNSDSTPSAEVHMDSPADSMEEEDEQLQSPLPRPSPDQGSLGIDEFGTNTTALAHWRTRRATEREDEPPHGSAMDSDPLDTERISHTVVPVDPAPGPEENEDIVPTSLDRSMPPDSVGHDPIPTQRLEESAAATSGGDQDPNLEAVGDLASSPVLPGAINVIDLSSDNENDDGSPSALAPVPVGEPSSTVKEEAGFWESKNLRRQLRMEEKKALDGKLQKALADQEETARKMAEMTAKLEEMQRALNGSTLTPAQAAPDSKWGGHAVALDACTSQVSSLHIMQSAAQVTESHPRVEDNSVTDPPSMEDSILQSPVGEIPCSSAAAEQEDPHPIGEKLCLSPARVDAQDAAIGMAIVVTSCPVPIEEPHEKDPHPLGDEELLDYGEGEKDDSIQMELDVGTSDAVDGKVDHSLPDETAQVHSPHPYNPYEYL